MFFFRSCVLESNVSYLKRLRQPFLLHRGNKRKGTNFVALENINTGFASWHRKRDVSRLPVGEASSNMVLSVMFGKR